MLIRLPIILFDTNVNSLTSFINGKEISPSRFNNGELLLPVLTNLGNHLVISVSYKPLLADANYVVKSIADNSYEYLLSIDDSFNPALDYFNLTITNIVDFNPKSTMSSTFKIGLGGIVNGSIPLVLNTTLVDYSQPIIKNGATVIINESIVTDTKLYKYGSYPPKFSEVPLISSADGLYKYELTVNGIIVTYYFVKLQTLLSELQQYTKFSIHNNPLDPKVALVSTRYIYLDQINDVINKDYDESLFTSIDNLITDSSHLLSTASFAISDKPIDDNIPVKDLSFNPFKFQL